MTLGSHIIRKYTEQMLANSDIKNRPSHERAVVTPTHIACLFRLGLHSIFVQCLDLFLS